MLSRTLISLCSVASLLMLLLPLPLSLKAKMSIDKRLHPGCCLDLEGSYDVLVLYFCDDDQALIVMFHGTSFSIESPV